MKNRNKRPGLESRAGRPPAIDPVAAFWLNMARTARTPGLRRLHAHLACQRADFLAFRLRAEQEQVPA